VKGIANPLVRQIMSRQIMFGKSVYRLSDKIDS